MTHIIHIPFNIDNINSVMFSTFIYGNINGMILYRTTNNIYYIVNDNTHVPTQDIPKSFKIIMEIGKAYIIMTGVRLMYRYSIYSLA